MEGSDLEVSDDSSDDDTNNNMDESDWGLRLSDHDSDPETAEDEPMDDRNDQGNEDPNYNYVLRPG